LDGLGASIGVGIAIALFVTVIFGLGAKYLSVKFFALFGTGLAILLADGLVTGATREWEEVHHGSTGQESTVVFALDVDTADATVMDAFGAIGLGSEMTQLTLCSFFITLAVLIYLQVWNNVYGREVYTISWCCKRVCKIQCRKQVKEEKPANEQKFVDAEMPDENVKEPQASKEGVIII
jgi:hypothetical protein